MNKEQGALIPNYEREQLFYRLRGILDLNPDERVDRCGNKQDWNLVLDLDRSWAEPDDKTRRKWVLDDDGIPVDYETGKRADAETIKRIDRWIISRAQYRRDNLSELLDEVDEKVVVNDCALDGDECPFCDMGDVNRYDTPCPYTNRHLREK